MNKNQVIIDISKYHVEWILYVVRNALNISQRRNAEDFVQNAYLKILKQHTFDPIKYYAADGKINKKYFFRTLKSLMIDENKKKKIKTISITSNIDAVDEIINKPLLEVVYKKLETTMNNMYWFDKKMLNLYVYHIPSIRKISTETTISSKAVFKTLKRCKLTIKKEVANEYYYGKAV
tara:strand:- start:2055 stop:2588 length:534 start_codon:yes stop_codon:yes gene_type:complete